jgi:hypothetical protein
VCMYACMYTYRVESDGGLACVVFASANDRFANQVCAYVGFFFSSFFGPSMFTAAS